VAQNLRGHACCRSLPVCVGVGPPVKSARTDLCPLVCAHLRGREPKVAIFICGVPICVGLSRPALRASAARCRALADGALHARAAHVLPARVAIAVAPAHAAPRIDPAGAARGHAPPRKRAGRTFDASRLRVIDALANGTRGRARFRPGRFAVGVGGASGARRVRRVAARRAEVSVPARGCRAQGALQRVLAHDRLQVGVAIPFALVAVFVIPLANSPDL